LAKGGIGPQKAKSIGPTRLSDLLGRDSTASSIRRIAVESLEGGAAMSVDLSEKIKRQIESLTAHERERLAAFLDALLCDRASNGNQVPDKTLRLKRMQWLKTHREEYGGQYVALDGDTLVAVGRSFSIARGTAQAAGKPNAFVTYLPKSEEAAEWGGWS